MDWRVIGAAALVAIVLVVVSVLVLGATLDQMLQARPERVQGLPVSA